MWIWKTIQLVWQAIFPPSSSILKKICFLSFSRFPSSCFYAQIKKAHKKQIEWNPAMGSVPKKNKNTAWEALSSDICSHEVLSGVHPILPVSSHWPTAGLLTDAVSLHYTLQCSDAPGTYVRALLVDVSSFLNTIRPDRLPTELLHLRVTRPICECSVGSLILTGNNSCIPGGHLLAVLAANTCAPQGCGPFPFSFHSALMTGSQAASSSLLSSHRRQEPPGKGGAVVSRIEKHGF